MPLPLSFMPIFQPTTWNTDMIAGALVTILGHEGKKNGRRLGLWGLCGTKVPEQHGSKCLPSLNCYCFWSLWFMVKLNHNWNTGLGTNYFFLSRNAIRSAYSIKKLIGNHYLCRFFFFFTILRSFIEGLPELGKEPSSGLLDSNILQCIILLEEYSVLNHCKVRTLPRDNSFKISDLALLFLVNVFMFCKISSGHIDLFSQV